MYLLYANRNPCCQFYKNTPHTKRPDDICWQLKKGFIFKPKSKNTFKSDKFLDYFGLVIKRSNYEFI